MKILRKTLSVCPICLETVQSFVNERDKKIFLSKDCPKHGWHEILLSNSPQYYMELEDYYFAVMDGRKEREECTIYITYKCNLNCPICGLEVHRINRDLEPSFEEIENFIAQSKHSAFILSGGDPTCRDDLECIIGVLKRYHKIVSINTNGLKLIDINYLKKLKDAGLDRVNLQFDGFSRKVYRVFRGRDLLDIKLKVLDNLRKIDIPTIFNVTVSRNTYSGVLKQLMEFAKKNNFIRAFNFLTICSLGNARNWPISDYIMPDDLIDNVEKETEGKITRRSFFVFQKLHYAVKSFFSQRHCFYSPSYVLIHVNGKYEPLDRYINFDRLNSALNIYKNIYRKNKFFARIFLISMMIFTLFTIRSLSVSKEFFFAGLSYLMTTKKYFKTKRFLYITFGTGCDPYKVDYRISRNCHNEIICKNSKQKKIGHIGKGTYYYIELERFNLRG